MNSPDGSGAAAIRPENGVVVSRSGWALVVLLVAYILNYVDRQIVGILAVPIKQDLALTDTELGLVGGLAFALFYTIMSVPVAWIADRHSRVKIIALACAAWSLFTALCGFAQNFWHLFLARMGVGIGETGCLAPSYSLISDLFPLHRRGRAIAFLQFGIPLGSAIGIFFGGWIASSIDWRAAFLIVGLAGLPVACFTWFGIKEPVRGIQDGAAGKGMERPPFGLVVRRLVETRSFWLFSLGSGFCSIVGLGLVFWLPSLIQRNFDLPLIHVSQFVGGLVLVGGLIGIAGGGWLADRLGPHNPRAYALIPAIATVLAAPTYTLAIFAPNLVLAFLLFLVAQILSLVGASPMVTAVQQVVPPAMRATASSLFLCFTNIIGMGFGTLLLGALSDLLEARHGIHALKYSVLYGVQFYFVASLMFLLAMIFIKRDRERAELPM